MSANHHPAMTPGALCANVVAALRYLAEVINQGLEFGPLRC
jgi:hypothetical protein